MVIMGELFLIWFPAYVTLQVHLNAYKEPEASTAMALVSVELRSSMEYDVELLVAAE